MDHSTPIVIIGAGLGGLAAAIQLRQAGYHNLRILEKDGKVGGTWAQNTYPGCSCDVPVVLYQYSFAPATHWTNTYPSSAELQAYCEQLVAQFDLGPLLSLATEAISAIWQADSHSWTITTKQGETLQAGAIISALGQLNRPAIPALPGQDVFAGASMHSAAWDHKVDLAGKKVGVIGSAASAVQLIPEVAQVAGKLVVFQRSANYIGPRGDREIPASEVALLMSNPAAAMDIGARNRALVFDTADTFFWQAFSWTPEGRAAYGEVARRHLESQIADPDLRAKLTPDYPVGCKRFLFTDTFYPALTLPHVTLETARIEQLTASGITVAGGVHHDLDVIIYATGFETTGWHWSLDVVGDHGQRLADQWAYGPEAYLGITTAHFPNFFMLYGPHTNLGHNSITYMMERQIDYIKAVLDGMAARQVDVATVTEDAQARFLLGLQDRLSATVWADPACNSWYKNDQGKITQNWGGNCRDYADAVRDVVWSDYTLEQGDKSA